MLLFVAQSAYFPTLHVLQNKSFQNTCTLKQVVSEYLTDHWVPYADTQDLHQPAQSVVRVIDLYHIFHKLCKIIYIKVALGKTEAMKEEKSESHFH